MAIDYSERIPNNVALADNRRLQRALEAWQPHYLQWWDELVWIFAISAEFTRRALS